MQRTIISLVATIVMGIGPMAVANEVVDGPITLSDEAMHNIVGGVASPCGARGGPLCFTVSTTLTVSAGVTVSQPVGGFNTSRPVSEYERGRPGNRGNLADFDGGG